MKKIILLIFIILICTCIYFFSFTKSSHVQETTSNQSEKIVNPTNTVNIERENKMISNIKVIINKKTYNAQIEQNETAQAFANMLPVEYKMNELNGNEKYINLDSSFPTNSYNPKHIEAGDIMLYGNNCLVVFYKSFDTPYSYTKIGHIEGMDDLGVADVTIRFE